MIHAGIVPVGQQIDTAGVFQGPLRFSKPFGIPLVIILEGHSAVLCFKGIPGIFRGVCDYKVNGLIRYLFQPIQAFYKE